MPKLAKILEQSSSTRQVSVYRSFFFSDHCMYKTKFNGFHVAVGLCSNRSQRTSKCGKNISDTCLPAARVPLPFYHNHFDVICDLLLNRSTATLVHVGRVTSFPSSLSYPSRDPGCVPHDLGKGQIHVKCEILMSLYIASTGQWKVQSVYSGPLKMI